MSEKAEEIKAYVLSKFARSRRNDWGGRLLRAARRTLASDALSDAQTAQPPRRIVCTSALCRGLWRAIFYQRRTWSREYGWNWKINLVNRFWIDPKDILGEVGGRSGATVNRFIEEAKKEGIDLYYE